MDDSSIAEAVRATLEPLEVEDAELPSVNLVEGESYEALSLGIVSAARALDVVQAPDAFRVYEYAGQRMMLATRRVEAGRTPFVQLAIASHRQGWRVTGAFRMRLEDEGELARLTADPALAFGTMLERYGLDYLAAGNRVRFVPVVELELDANRLTQDPMSLFNGLGLERGPAHSLLLHTALRVNEGNSVTLAWTFALSGSDYEREQR